MTGKRRKGGQIDGEPDPEHIHVFRKIVSTTYNGNVRNVERRCSCGKSKHEYDRLSDVEIESIKRRGEYTTG